MNRDENGLPASFQVYPSVPNPLIPRLVDICIDTIVENYTDCSKLHLVPKKYHKTILQKLPFNISLPIAVMSIPDGIYWKKLLLHQFPGIPHDPTMTRWKQFYLEQYASKQLENATASNVDEVFESMKVVGPYIRTIKMKRSPCKVSIAKLFKIFRGLRKLSLVYGEPRKSFAQYEEFDSFEIQSELSATMRDCTAMTIDFEAIGSFCPLQELDMSDNSLSDKCAQMIARGLVKLNSLTSLVLSHNEISNQGAHDLALVLTTSPIKYLDLSDNKIGADGVQYIAMCCEKRKSIEYLNLSSNQLGDKGVVSIAQIVEHVPSLKHLDISGNRIEYVGPLVDSLKTNRTLKVLIIAANPLNPNEAMNLRDTLEASQTLEKVDMRVYESNEDDYVIKTTETSEAPLLRIK